MNPTIEDYMKMVKDDDKDFKIFRIKNPDIAIHTRQSFMRSMLPYRNARGRPDVSPHDYAYFNDVVDYEYKKAYVIQKYNLKV